MKKYYCSCGVEAVIFCKSCSPEIFCEKCSSEGHETRNKNHKSEFQQLKDLLNLHPKFILFSEFHSKVLFARGNAKVYSSTHQGDKVALKEVDEEEFKKEINIFQ